MTADWVEDFYSRTGRWWGPAESAVGERDRSRIDLVRQIAGPPPQRMLELGAGYGNTAAVALDAGYSVTAVEISDRVRFAPDRLHLIRGDFYQVELPGRFDVVCYWNGFGIGSDADQRRLLRRISGEWLTPGGRALIDISNPFVWAGWDGDTESREPDPASGYAYAVKESTEFDPVQCRAVDSWWESGHPEATITQTLRCYTPADLQLLLEGTGLQLEGIHVGGERVEITRPRPGLHSLLHQQHEYLAVLVRPEPGAPPSPAAGGAAG